MQIELIGCTSAGKSTLIKRILQASQGQQPQPLTSYDFVLTQFKLHRIKNHIIRTLLLNLLALLACLVTWPKNLDFWLFAVGVILRLPATITCYEKLKIARLVVRNVGVYEIVCHYGSDQQVVLADEGTLQLAHSLFVHVSIEPNINEVETFIRLVPLPDVVVYVKQPESALVDRTRERGHKRISPGSLGLAERFIKRAVVTFDKIVQSPLLESKLLVTDNEQNIIVAPAYQSKPWLVNASKLIQTGVERVAADDPVQTRFDQNIKMTGPRQIHFSEKQL